MWTKLAHFIIKYRLILILVISSITVFMGFQATKVRMTFKFAELVPRTHESMKQFLDFKKTFGQDANLMVVGFKDKALFEKEIFDEFNTICSDLVGFEGIDTVFSISNVQVIERDAAGRRFHLKSVFEKEPKNQQELDSMLAVIRSFPFYEGRVFSKDNESTIVILALDSDLIDSKARNPFVKDIVSRFNDFAKNNNIQVHYAGLPHVRTIMTSRVKKELNKFLILSLLVTALVLWFFFRSLNAVIFPILIIGSVVIWTVGTIVLFGYEISMLTGLIPPIIVVIGIPNSIYLLNKYHQEYVKHENKIKAMSTVIRKIGIVTLITNCTTAIGFLVLLSAEIPILREFGIVAGLNVLVTFVISIILIPAVFSYLPEPNSRHLKHLDFKGINGVLDWLEFIVTKRRKFIFITSLIVLVVAVYGSFQVHPVSYMVDDLPKGDVVKEDLQWFEDNFTGVMPLEIVIDTKEKNGIKRIETLQKLDQFERYLESQPELSKSLSLVSLIKSARQAIYFGDSSYYDIPTNQDKNRILAAMKRTERSYKAGNSANLAKSYADTTGRYRLSLKVGDIGSQKMASLISDRLQPKADEIFGENNVIITGTTKLFLEGNKYLIKNLRYSLFLAVFLISIIMALLFRSLRMVIISLIPNLIPLAVTGALMGYLGVPLKPSTALIFSIAFGISVDDSIHYLAKYRQELFHTNFSVSKAVSLSIRETGASMIYTSIVLFFGFIVFAFSSFGGTVMLGLLTSCTLLFAMITNLTLLPSLLMIFDTGKREGKSKPFIDTYNQGAEEELQEEIKELESKIEGDHSNTIPQNSPEKELTKPKV